MFTNCQHCNAPLSEAKRRRRAKFCSRGCNNAKWKLGYRALNPRPNVPTGTRGAISELAVSADLLRKGHAVFRALSPSCSCDLVVLTPGNTLLRIEVTTGARNVTGAGIQYPPKKHERHDILAVVLHDEIRYIPDLPAA